MQGSVHHELLMALSGYPGNIFRVSKDDGTIEVDSILPFVHPSEASLLNRLCQLGTHYKKLRDFISEQNSSTFTLPNDPTNPSQLNSSCRLYLKTLASGLDKVLHSYRQELVRLEKKCVNEPHLPLSHLQAELEEYHLLLPALRACVAELSPPASSYHGCQILSYLHDQCNSGIPCIQEAFQLMLSVCHGVLYKQLSAWMLHGLLQEDSDEFFIARRQKKKEKKGVGQQEEDKEEVEEGEDERGVADTKPSESGEGDGGSWEYVVHYAMAPSYFSVRILEKILFVGKAVTVFQDTERLRTSARDRYGVLLVTTADSRLRGDQLLFADMLTKLQQEPKFQLQELERVVDAIRDRVAELLWKLLVEESNLVGHLQVLKDFYLLGRGEMYLAFIDLANHFMVAPPTANTHHDVNLALRQAMSRVGLDSEKMSKQFELAVPFTKKRDRGRGRSKDKAKTKGEEVEEVDGSEKTKMAATPVHSASAWDQLSLNHTCQWPMHTLLTPSILSKYNSLFQVLLKLRRAQVSLHQCWALLMQHHRRESSLWQVWELRTHMSFLVDNLQYYVQVDVLEAQFAQLLHQVKATNDFEKIFHAHETFLTTLQSQLFLTMPAVNHCLQELLALCQSLCRLLDSSENLQLGAREKAEVARIARDFSRQSSLFFDLISGVRVHSSAAYLTQLLLRVDYNKYYSSLRRNKNVT